MADHRWTILNAALAVGDGDVGLARADGARQGLPNIVYQQPLWPALSAELDTDLLLTLIHPAEKEVLLDEGEAYARELDDAGADMTNVRYNGTIHDFALLNALLDVPSTGTALRQAATDLATTSADVMARLALDQPSDYRGHDRTDPNRASRGDNDYVTMAVGPTSLVLT